MADICTVERPIDINASAASVHVRIVDFHNWKAWGPETP